MSFWLRFVRSFFLPLVIRCFVVFFGKVGGVAVAIHAGVKVIRLVGFLADALFPGQIGAAFPAFEA